MSPPAFFKALPAWTRDWDTSRSNVQWVRTSQWARKEISDFFSRPRWGPHPNMTILLAKWSVLREFWWWWWWSICRQICGVHGDCHATAKLGRPDIVRLAQLLRSSRLGRIFGTQIMGSMIWVPNEEELDDLAVSDCRAFEGFMQSYSTSLHFSLLFEYWSRCWVMQKRPTNMRRSDQWFRIVSHDFTNFRFHHRFCNFTTFTNVLGKWAKKPLHSSLEGKFLEREGELSCLNAYSSCGIKCSKICFNLNKKTELILLKRKACREQTRKNPLDSGQVFWTRKCTRFYTYAVNIKHSDSFKTLCHLFTRFLRGLFYLQFCFCISVLVDHKGLVEVAWCGKQFLVFETHPYL